MGARPSSFKKGGGGFLGNVDSTLTGYEFVVGDTVEIKKGPRKGEDFTPLSFVPSFRQDGADEDVTKRLLIGDAANFGEVSDDGLTLATPDGQSIPANSEAGLFISSLVKPHGGGDGFPEERLSDDEDSINYEPIIGTRLRTVNVVNVERTKRQGQEKGKDGKLYDRRDLLVETVYEAPAGKSGKSAGKTAPAGKSAKPAAKGKKDNGVAELATDTLLAVLGDTEDGEIPKAKLRIKLMQKLGKNELRDDVIKYLYDDENLSGIDGVVYDPADKKQLIKLDA